MKDWVLGRRFMEEQPGNGGEGGGGGGTGGAGGETPKGGGEESPAPQGDDDDIEDPEHPGKGGEGQTNALGEDLKKGGEGEPKPGEKPDGEEKPKEQQPDTSEPTEAEVKAYTDAMKLDEATFGKGVKLDDSYMSKLPGLFKRHGIAPDKVGALTNDFVKMQKEIVVAKETARAEARNATMQRLNQAYYEKYDKPARESIARAINKYFPDYGKDRPSPMRKLICEKWHGVDPQFLALLKDAVDRIPKDSVPGAAAGAGSGGGGKSISDSFMGL